MSGQTQTTLLISTLVLVILIANSSACFIRNCPRGGKRAMDSTELSDRQCMSCMGTGTCVGPNICCGHKIGCHIGTAESHQCTKENESLSPCRVPGSSCGGNMEGKCVADGICCNSDACQMDGSCRNNEQLKPELIQLLKRLLASKRGNSGVRR